jgi:hypothetical protein
MRLASRLNEFHGVHEQENSKRARRLRVSRGSQVVRSQLARSRLAACKVIDGRRQTKPLLLGPQTGRMSAYCLVRFWGWAN